MCIKLVIKTSLYYDARSEKHLILKCFRNSFYKTNNLHIQPLPPSTRFGFRRPSKPQRIMMQFVKFKYTVS
jgi:hypothetical protein